MKPRRPSPALLVAIGALVVAMGGSAVAATKLLVHTDNIANGAVTAHKLHSGAVDASKLSGALRRRLNSRPAAAQRPRTVYSNLPKTVPDNVPSEGFESGAISEFGGLVKLAAGSRRNPIVEVLMSSWACQQGNWSTNDSCVTTPGAKFSEPITVNLYRVRPHNAIGRLIYSDTQTFEIPYRPSANPACIDGSGNETGQWKAADDLCSNGLAVPIRFDLGGTHVVLPNRVIVSFAYNTTDDGYQPQGSQFPCHSTTQGCGYDSLNVGLIDNRPASVGSDPAPNTIYQMTTQASNTNGTVGVFSPDVAKSISDPAGYGDGENGYYQPAIAITTNN